MTCSACLDFHHAQLYQPLTLFSTRSLQNAKRDKLANFQLLVSTVKLSPPRQRSQKIRWIFFRVTFTCARARELLKATSFGFPRERIAAPVCQRNSLKFKMQLSPARSAATFPKRQFRGKQSWQFQRILSGASDLSLPTRNAVNSLYPASKLCPTIAAFQ